MYAIFHENKALIVPSIDEEQIDFFATRSQSDAYEVEIFQKILNNWLTNPSITDSYVEHISSTVLTSALARTFRLAPAAGGVVFSESKLVCIVRNGIPDLPKGHVEDHETHEKTALREVCEETGIESLHIVQKLPTTWHCYDWQGEWRLKPTYWFVMRTDSHCLLKPQTEENIESVKLIGKEELDPFFKNTFRSIRDVLEKDVRKFMDSMPPYQTQEAASGDFEIV